MVLRLLVLLLVLLGIHSAYQIYSPEIRNSMLEGKMKKLVEERGLKGERELRRDTLAFAREKNIPINDGDIIVEITNDHVVLAAHYRTSVKVWFYEKDYEFYPSSDPNFRMRPQVQRTSSRR